LLGSWHLVGTADELSKSGDFLTCDLLGRPIQVRNFRGDLRALSNVCAHRHCLISSQSRGSSPSMRCQYHGWEYSSSGRPCKIPAPHNFVPFPKENVSLRTYRVARAGQLVLVCLDPNAPDLAEQWGEWLGVCEERFGQDWQPYFRWDPNYEANWKVPVENSLEAYHVPCVHPKTFGSDPGAERSQHHLGRNGTAFHTTLPFAHAPLDRYFQAWEGRIVQWLGAPRHDTYSQHHLFPNLLFSFTDAISFCQCVLPTGPNRCRAIVRQFGRHGKAGWQKLLARGWGHLKAAITASIVREDQALFASIQRGLEASDQAGLLGKCEERIHAFHQYLLENAETRA
jgi:phenylpropionate dioxygenase-like ring-hydroxylating dioxygenase large terminal subunit